MKVNFDYKNTTYSIEEKLAKMPIDLDGQSKIIIKKASKIIQAKVVEKFKQIESSLPPEASNYDGTVPYVHMADDVKASVKDDKTGNVYAVIKGGKYTGYKWHMVENGTSKMKALHPIEKAMKETENEIDSMVDEAIRKLVNGGE